MSSNPTPSSPLSEPTPTPLPAIRSSDSSTTTTRHLSAMPAATLHSLQANEQSESLLNPPITLGAQLRADQTPPRLEDWADGRTTDPIWPDYALPKANLPPATAEALQARLSKLAQVQAVANTDLMYSVQNRDWSREIRMSADGVSDGDSPVWMTLIRSRWLVIETLRGHLQLWDIEGAGDADGVLGSFSALEGSVDGAVVTDKAGGPVELFISTTKYRTYSFVLDLPHQNQDHKDAYGLAPQHTILGFSGLKDKKKGLGFLSVSHATTPLVRLAAGSEVAEVRVDLDVRAQGWKTYLHTVQNQNVLDMLLRDDVIVVARNRTIDLYSRPDVLEILGTKQGTPLPFAQLQESFSIPNHGFLHHTRLLRRAPAYVGTTHPGIYCSSFTRSGWVVSHIKRNDAQESGRPSPRYSLLGANVVAHGELTPLMLSWGESGSRTIGVGDRTLDMHFADSRESPESGGGDRDHYLAQWKIPRDTRDTPRCAAFDEATGIAVVGMESGRLLVADAGNWVPPLPGRDDDSDSESEGSRSWDSRSIHPSPKRWPQIGSNPAMFMPKDLEASEYSGTLAPGWFEGLEKWYPFANHPTYYGSIPWMVREVLGIPSGSRCNIFSSMDIDFEHGSNNALIELDAEVGNGGRLLLLLWSGEHPLDFRLYQLLSKVIKEEVVQNIKKGKPLGLFLEDRPWVRNPLSMGRLAEWIGRHQEEEEERTLMKFDLALLPHV